MNRMLRLPNAVIRSREWAALNVSEVRVWLVLLDDARPVGGTLRARRSLKQIGEWANEKPRTVARSVRGLITKGWLERYPDLFGGTCLYRILCPVQSPVVAILSLLGGA